MASFEIGFTASGSGHSNACRLPTLSQTQILARLPHPADTACAYRLVASSAQREWSMVDPRKSYQKLADICAVRRTCRATRSL